MVLCSRQSKTCNSKMRTKLLRPVNFIIAIVKTVTNKYILHQSGRQRCKREFIIIYRCYKIRRILEPSYNPKCNLPTDNNSAAKCLKFYRITSLRILERMKELRRSADRTHRTKVKSGKLSTA